MPRALVLSILAAFAAISAFAENHLSPHFPPGATDLVPMETAKPNKNTLWRATPPKTLGKNTIYTSNRGHAPGLFEAEYWREPLLEPDPNLFIILDNDPSRRSVIQLQMWQDQLAYRLRFKSK